MPPSIGNFEKMEEGGHKAKIVSGFQQLVTISDQKPAIKQESQTYTA